jgi:NADH-ubiquinone oxidoreductase chain 2
MIFYIIQYSLTNLNTFLVIIALGYLINSSINKLNNQQMITGKENDINLISELKGQFFSNPLLSLSLTISLFSMAGMPPLVGFFSKQFVLYSALQSGYYFMAIVAIIVSVISASYYLKIIRVLHSNPAEENSNITPTNLETENNNITTDSYSTPSSTHSFLISSLTLSILLFVLKPSIILNSTQLLALSLYNF